MSTAGALSTCFVDPGVGMLRMTKVLDGSRRAGNESSSSSNSNSSSATSSRRPPQQQLEESLHMSETCTKAAAWAVFQHHGGGGGGAAAAAAAATNYSYRQCYGIAVRRATRFKVTTHLLNSSSVESQKERICMQQPNWISQINTLLLLLLLSQVSVREIFSGELQWWKRVVNMRRIWERACSNVCDWFSLFVVFFFFLFCGCLFCRSKRRWRTVVVAAVIIIIIIIMQLCQLLPLLSATAMAFLWTSCTSGMRGALSSIPMSSTHCPNNSTEPSSSSQALLLLLLLLLLPIVRNNNNSIIIILPVPLRDCRLLLTRAI